MHFIRSLVVQAQMRTMTVVKHYGVAYCSLCLLIRPKRQIEIKLVLQNPVYSFGHGILRTVVRIGHASQHSMLSKLFEKLVAAVLAPTITVVHNPNALFIGSRSLIDYLYCGAMAKVP